MAGEVVEHKVRLPRETRDELQLAAAIYAKGKKDCRPSLQIIILAIVRDDPEALAARKQARQLQQQPLGEPVKMRRRK